MRNHYGNGANFKDMSKLVKKAEDYLLHSTKGKASGASHIVKDGNIKYTKRNKETISHVETANALLKIINVTPGLSSISRKIMSTRLINPGISTLSIALQLGLRELDVKRYEDEGKNRVKDYIKFHSMESNIEKFNTERVIANELKNLNKTGKANPMISAA